MALSQSRRESSLYFFVFFQIRNGVGNSALEGGGGNPPQSCVDSAVGEDAGDKPVVPYPCHEQGGNQVKNRERRGSCYVFK